MGHNVLTLSDRDILHENKNLLDLTGKNYLENKYRKDGFLNTKVTLNTIKDSIDSNTYKMVVNIDKGPRVKIKDIKFEGNQIFFTIKIEEPQAQNFDSILEKV